jgi:superfamily II DNA or RNA helicase
MKKKTEEQINAEMRNKINSQKFNTYLGQKGFTLTKDELSIETQIWIKEQLMVRPFTQGSPVQVQKTFPVYRESAKKIYIPRYFGEELFGKPDEIKITEGENTNMIFNGKLRDYQEPVVNKYLNYVRNTKEEGAGGLLELYCAWGKTSASLYICCQLKKKTLVIVHKEFLMNQWIERIRQFIPEARIGKIQGQIIDIEDKDIVLCMLQSLVLKEYPSSTFDSFGFTIIDEVHHISSESFSNALFKIVTKYMLGLSATMNRKDGTTKVFKMFLGDVIHKAERKNEINVEIRSVTYKTNDDDFNEVILDFRGKPQSSSMISKLCSYNRRTEFIIRLLTDFIREDNINEETYKLNKEKMDKAQPSCKICDLNKNYLVKNTCCNTVNYCLPCLEEIKTVTHKFVDENDNKKQYIERPKCPNCKKSLKYEQNYIINSDVKPLEKCQTILLAHNINVLEYIYKKFVCKNLASVAYYIGGMKEVELKNSESKQVILATYSMAAEALDIPSLNAEFLITPKTDVVQTIGRVLRAKHKYAEPIIYDIVDTHEIFQNQWSKRRVYYKKNGYKIISTDSTNYTINTSQWKLLNKGMEHDSDVNSDTSEEEKGGQFAGKCLLKIKK